MNSTKYEIRYATSTQLEAGTYKSICTDDFEQALRMYDKIKRFAEKHNLTMGIALWGNRWLVQSTTINPTKIIYA